VLKPEFYQVWADYFSRYVTLLWRRKQFQWLILYYPKQCVGNTLKFFLFSVQKFVIFEISVVISNFTHSMCILVFIFFENSNSYLLTHHIQEF
jgi:hypothetical protein